MIHSVSYEQVQLFLKNKDYKVKEVVREGRVQRLEVWCSPLLIDEKIKELRNELGNWCFVQKWDQDSIFVGLKDGSLDFTGKSMCEKIVEF